MAKDFYLKSAKQQFDSLRSARAQTLAELEAAKQSNDKFAAAQSVQQLADIAASEQNLAALVNQYTASQAPPPELSPEEKAARPIERMDYRDAFELAQRGSKYGVDVNAFNEGLREVARRRARGE